MKVAVIGAAGGIGQALALLLKNHLPAGSDLALYDIAPVTPGVAADLSHIPTPVSIKGYSGEDPTPALEGADVVLISAGVARKPGMDRADLFNVNAGIVKSLAEKIAVVCPTACVGIITNPVNTTVPIAAEVLKKGGLVAIPTETVYGLGANALDENALIGDFNIKYVGALRCARAVLPYMQQQGWGKIVNISGINARKAGNFKLADQIRDDLLNKGIIIEDKQDKTEWKYK